MVQRSGRRRSATALLVALAEIALIAAIVLVALGRRVGAVSDWVERVPGGGLVVVGVAVVLLVLAAGVMTVIVSE